MEYNKRVINSLIETIHTNNGIGDKSRLEIIIKEKFNLIIDRSVYYNEHFSIRFSQSKTESFSNTVLSLSALRKYDSRPFIVCLVMPDKNRLLLANSSCLSKISHSSHELRIDNIKGSFNGSDIMKYIGDFINAPENFETLFMQHLGFSFEENLARLVESTNEIVGRDTRYIRNTVLDINIMDAPERAKIFLTSKEYFDLSKDLVERVEKVKNEIVIASLIVNVNLRGRIIEYLITNGESDGISRKIITSLNNNTNIPPITTEDGLGDYDKEYDFFSTKTDIKTKVLYFNSAPKAYNIDKLLSFLANEKSVYMIFFIGITNEKEIKTYLCSMFSERLLDATVIQFHWAGRNSRGVTQFSGKVIDEIITTQSKSINIEKSKKWLEKLLNL